MEDKTENQLVEALISGSVATRCSGCHPESHPEAPQFGNQSTTEKDMTRAFLPHSLSAELGHVE